MSVTVRIRGLMTMRGLLGRNMNEYMELCMK